MHGVLVFSALAIAQSASGVSCQVHKWSMGWVCTLVAKYLCTGPWIWLLAYQHVKEWKEEERGERKGKAKKTFFTIGPLCHWTVSSVKIKIASHLVQGTGLSISKAWTQRCLWNNHKNFTWRHGIPTWPAHHLCCSILFLITHMFGGGMCPWVQVPLKPRGRGAPDLELQVSASYLRWVLGTELPGVLGKSSAPLNY